VIKRKIYGSVVKSFAVWPLEFLLSSETPYCKNILKIYGAAPAAANITLLFPEQSTSSQCNPAFNRIEVTSRWFLKHDQCKGFGFNYFVDPMATCLFSSLTSRYCWPAPFANNSFTIAVYPEQHAQISAFHFFFVFSKLIK
jgi:hypothetical protein